MLSDSEAESIYSSVCSYNYSNSDTENAFTKEKTDVQRCIRGRRHNQLGQQRRRFALRTGTDIGRESDDSDGKYSNDSSSTRRDNYSKKRKIDDEEKEKHVEVNCTGKEIADNRGYSDRGANTERSGNDVNFGITTNFMERRPSIEYSRDSEECSDDCIEGEAVRHEATFVHDVARNLWHIEEPETARSRIYKLFDKGFREVAARKRILHDVYKSNFNNGPVRLDTQQIHRRFTGAILIIAYHRDHYHVVHDCSYSNSSCRCEFQNYFKSSQFGKRFSRRIVPSYDFSIEHWLHLAVYFQKGRRQCNYMELARRVWIPGNQARHLRLQQDLRNLQGSMVEEGNIPIDFYDQFGCGSERNFNHQVDVSCCSRSEENTGHQKRGKGDEIVFFLQRRPTSPVTHLFSMSIWLQSKYKFFDTGSILIKNCVRIVNNSYNEQSLTEIYNFFRICEPQHLIFNAPMGNSENYYYNINDSIEILEKLIFFQNNNNLNKVLQFLTDLYNVMDKKILKKNSIFILSAPNAGKNFFFDSFIHFCINFGQMGNFNRYCSFPLMECVDRRVILWNEPVMEASAVETLKMILGGDTVNAKVKYQNDAVITRTPVIVLSNNDIFPKDEAFRSRMYSYNWKPCNFLKKCSKKPNPIASYLLLKKYKIV